MLVTLLFLDFTGTLHRWFGWIAKIQFLPALLALNVGVVVALIVLTVILGRIYCSVICPLGVFQDVVSWFAGKRKKNRFSYSLPHSWLRYSVLGLFVIALVVGAGFVVTIIEPYSTYGRIASNLFLPVYQKINNLFAYFAERINSYWFYSVDVWIKSIVTLSIAIATLLVIVILSWRNGRTYCNTICPVGTILGFISRYSFFKISIDTVKCNGCGVCARNCKSSCIDPREHKIDYSRCVACMDCIGKCRQNAINYNYRSLKPEIQHIENSELTDNSRRKFLSVTSLLAVAAVVGAQSKKVEGGLTVLSDKKVSKRTTSLTPAGSLSARNLAKHCTACQLCISECPNQVLRPSDNLKDLMQPKMSYERGYCRPECTRCSQVCPTGAINKITPAEKSSVQIGHAVWVKDNCTVITDKVSCGNCARHCPVGAIQMVPQDAGNADSLKIPVVNTERCIGCGACENLCPSRPYSAIYVEGHEIHRTI
jgi:ferredoxin